MLRIEFFTQPYGVLEELHEAMPGSTIAINSVLPIDRTEWLAFLTANGQPSRPGSVVEQTANVELLYDQTYSPSSATSHLVVVVENNGSCIAQTLARNRAIPHSLSVKDHTLKGVVTVTDWDHLRSLAHQIEITHDEFELLSVTQVDHVGSLLGSDRFKETIRSAMTREQLQTLETAHRMGYFGVPQAVTASEVGDELEVSQSTVSERLRRALANLLIVVFGAESSTPEQPQ